ncbi:uncharacterized protein LOC136015950 [Lathamus discolor]|uniref:uncharacterized protein LOC136015950 n=1 Tax=Lathamus discolor TaxID=678569 RepID=UPI0032B778F4
MGEPFHLDKLTENNSLLSLLGYFAANSESQTPAPSTLPHGPLRSRCATRPGGTRYRLPPRGRDSPRRGGGGGGRHVGTARRRRPARRRGLRRGRPARPARGGRGRFRGQTHEPEAAVAAAVGASGPNPARADLCGRRAGGEEGGGDKVDLQYHHMKSVEHCRMLLSSSVSRLVAVSALENKAAFPPETYRDKSTLQMGKELKPTSRAAENASPTRGGASAFLWLMVVAVNAAATGAEGRVTYECNRPEMRTKVTA